MPRARIVGVGRQVEKRRNADIFKGQTEREIRADRRDLETYIIIAVGENLTRGCNVNE